MSNNRWSSLGVNQRNIRDFINLNDIPEQGYVFENLGALVNFIESFNTEGYYLRGQSGLWHIVSSLHRFLGTGDEQRASIIFSVVANELLNNPFIKKARQSKVHSNKLKIRQKNCSMPKNTLIYMETN